MLYNNSKEHIYTIVTAPVTPPLAVTLDEVKDWLRIDNADCKVDNQLTMLIKAAQQSFESYTKLTLFHTKFKTTRDYFGQDWELRRGTIQSINRFEYKVGGILTAVDPSIYFLHKHSHIGFGYIALKENQSWPLNNDCEKDSIEIDFTAGIAADYKTIPYDIKLAILNTVNCMNAHRGDCSASEECSPVYAMGLSRSALAIADKYKIIDIGGRL